MGEGKRKKGKREGYPDTWWEGFEIKNEQVTEN